MLDPALVRAHFPALDDDWALFDHAGGSPPLAGVIDRVASYMRRGSVQLGATYAASARAAAEVAAGRAAAARLVNATPEEVVLGHSTTSNVRHLARAFAPLVQPGDEIVVTNLDHEANVGAWRELESRGAIVREWGFDPGTLALTADGLRAVLTPRTRLVAFTLVSNLVGAIHDAAALVRLAHEAGAFVCVDAVAFAPHRRVDVRALGADATLVSLYKVFGPHVGLMHVRAEWLPRLARQNHFFLTDAPPPYALEPGGVAHELVASLPAIPDYLESLAGPEPGGDPLARAFEHVARHEQKLVGPLLEFLAGRRGVRVLGPTDADASVRVPTVSFVVDGRHASEVPRRLDAERVAVRWGHFYAYRAVEALGLGAAGGVVRASLAHVNTPAEVSRLIAALDRAL